MGETDKAFRSPADRGAAIWALFSFAPVEVMCAAGAAAHGFDAGSLIVVGLVLAGVLWAMVLVARAAAFVECSPEWITVGLAPFWRTRLFNRDLLQITVVGSTPTPISADGGSRGRPGTRRDGCTRWAERRVCGLRCGTGERSSSRSRSRRRRSAPCKRCRDRSERAQRRAVLRYARQPTGRCVQGSSRRGAPGALALVRFSMVWSELRSRATYRRAPGVLVLVDRVVTIGCDCDALP